MFSKINDYFSKDRWETLFIVILLATTIPLRFINLGYSDYIGDEHKSFIEPAEKETLVEFFLSRRKGPVQFLISEIPHAITGDYRIELAERIPYAIYSVMSVLMFYFLVKKFTKSKEISFFASLLFSFNGFIVGFGRIAQYQNLNLFFSFAALFYYLDLLEKKKSHLSSTLIGTFLFCISFLSHWDAVFIVPVIIVIFVIYLLNKKINIKQKLFLLVLNTALGCLLLLPFLIPFVEIQKTTTENLRYLGRRLDLGYLNYDRYVQLIDLYNPFYVRAFLVIGSAISLFWIRKNWIFLFWFASNYAVFEYFVRKPGTHIYNFLIPMFVLSSFAIVELKNVLPKVYRRIFLGVVILFLFFFFHQAYMIYVDHGQEYPWENETLLTFLCPEVKDRLGRITVCGEFMMDNFQTEDYVIGQKLPLFGFPLFRNWNKINEVVLTDMAKIGKPGYSFITNEEKTISQWYMTPGYRADGGVYVVGVKRPLSFVEDWGFGQYPEKTLIETIYKEGDAVVKIWRVEPELNPYTK